MLRGAYFDHTAIMEIVEGNRNVLKVVEETPAFYTGAHILALVCGAEEYMVEKKFYRERKIRTLIENFRILDITKEDAIKAAEIIGKMKAGGVEIALDEALTMSHAFLHNLVLVTKDKGFARRAKQQGIEVKVI